MADSTSGAVQKHRDVLKMMTAMSDGETAYLILGIENQSEIDYTMPVRVMLYDALQLNSQTEAMKKKHRNEKDVKQTKSEWLSGWNKTDILIPVITLVIYFGEKDWDAPKSLHEMMRIEHKDISKNVQDYRIRLIAPNEISDEEFDKFHTGLREVLKYIKYCKDKEKLLKVTTEDKAFHNVDIETAMTINVVTNSKLDISQGKGSMNMCKAIQDIRMDGIIEGKMIGREEGREEGRRENKYQTATTLIKMGLLSYENISVATGLTVEEIENLALSL